MYANDFRQDGSLTPTHDSSFRFKKSYFFLDDFIVCLGSDIYCDDMSNDVITTLFQGKLKNTSDTIVLDNANITAFPFSSTVANGDHWLLDAYGTGYHIESSQGLNIARRNQTSLQQDGTGTTSGNFATAWLNHGKVPSGAGYEYIVKPSTDATGMQTFSAAISGASKPYEVLQKDANAHILKFGSLEAYALFANNSNLGNAVVKANSKPCLVMLQGSNPISLTLVNPDLGLAARSYENPDPVAIELILDGTWRIIAADQGVSLVSTNGSETVLQFVTDDGEPFDAQLLNENAQVEERTFIFNPVQDAHTIQASPDVNTGSNTKLSIRSDKYSTAMNGYQMFDVDVEGMLVFSANLKLYCTQNPIVLTVHEVADTNWTETALTWNNQPSMGDVIDSHSVGQNVWEVFDVSSCVTGDGRISFGLMNNEASYSLVDSKEGANPPVLEVVAVSRNGDKDEDGLPNDWELAYFGGETNAVASADPDGDAFDNLHEYIAGTDPTNGAAFFVASNRLDPAGFVVLWNSITGRTYAVSHCAELGAVFTNLQSGMDFPQHSYTDTAHTAEDTGFYQVDVQLVK
jgi:hypothetical protein